MLGGLSSTGAMVATFAATSRGGNQPLLVNPTSVVIQVAIEYALKTIDEPHDEELWYRLTAAETQIGAEINRLAPLSDDDSPSVKRLGAALATIEKLMAFMEEKGLSPQRLRPGPQELAAATRSDAWQVKKTPSIRLPQVD